ncbi:hypothetical protein, partial [Candidatus Symbiothrix dinenymphae]|uniref:hypothetical protein n=1 Tax=Candidatus Symbiothrix dinenymphae TaxID=467085 RepID=UPI0013155B76
IIRRGTTNTPSFTLNELGDGKTTQVNITYRLLPKDGIDTVDVARVLEVKTMSQLAFNDYINETRMFPDPAYATDVLMGTFGVTQIPHTLRAGQPCEFPGADFDYGADRDGDGKGNIAWYRVNGASGQSAAEKQYRVDRGDPNCSVRIGYGDLLPGYT